jgi:hypothetical protein
MANTIVSQVLVYTGGIVICHRLTLQSKNIYTNKCVCNIDVIFVKRRLHVSATLPSSGLYKIKVKLVYTFISVFNEEGKLT